MARRKTLSDHGIASLKPKATRYTVADPECGGHYIRVTPNGAKSFVVVAREPHAQKQVWAMIGRVDHFTIEEARERAREAVKRIRAGQTAFEPLSSKPESFEEVTREYLQRHVAGNGHLRGAETKRIFEKYVLPAWGTREFASIRKSDVAKLLNAIEGDDLKHRHRAQADKALAAIRGLMHWKSNQTDDYTCPISDVLRRSDPRTRKRDRVLSDDEILLIWPLFAGPYGAMAKLGLLTAQRLRKIAAMKWSDVSEDGVWTVPHSDREKGVGGALALPELALQVIRAQPHIAGNDFVFAGRIKGPFNGFSGGKARLDAKVKIAPWVFHDLRRTSRTLLARAGVQTEIAERILGHVQSTIVETYNRHGYDREKQLALAKLANEIARILEGLSANVVPLRGAS